MQAKAGKLVQRCLADVTRHPVEHIDVYLEDDITVWYLILHFPEEAPFIGGAGGALKAANFALYVQLTFPDEFPARPPQLKFLSPWINHQHIWGDRICHSLLTNDFQDYFREQQTHGTSLWNASCALTDSDGIGGMPRYLQILREYLANDLDYDDEKHVKYSAASLEHDVARQRDFFPNFLANATSLLSEDTEADVGDHESVTRQCSTDLVEKVDDENALEQWGIDFFLKSPLIAGDPDTHPCFDVAVIALGGRPPTLSTTMTTLCEKSFNLGAEVTDFGTPISCLLPYPCTTDAWLTAGRALSEKTLAELVPITQIYQLNLFCVDEAEAKDLEATLNIVGELWRSTCINIVKGNDYESERAMTCFVTLHFYLLRLTQEKPALQSHAVSSVREFFELLESEPTKNLKICIPDLGRFMVRFLLTEGEVPFRNHVAGIVRELFNRNVRWVDPSLWAGRGASEEEKAMQVEASFEAGHFGMKLAVFQSYYILRSAELGLDTLAAMETCHGKPSPETLCCFQNDYKKIKALSSYDEFFAWFQLENTASVDTHSMLCDAVIESEVRGYNGLAPARGP